MSLSFFQNMDQWTMRQSSLELQLMIKQSTNNVGQRFFKKAATIVCCLSQNSLALFLIYYLTGAVLTVGKHS